MFWLRILGDPRTRTIDLHILTYPGQTCLDAILSSLRVMGCDAHLQPGDTIGFAITSHTSRTEPDQSEPMQGEHNNTPNLQLNRPSLTSIPRSNERIGWQCSYLLENPPSYGVRHALERIRRSCWLMGPLHYSYTPLDRRSGQKNRKRGE